MVITDPHGKTVLHCVTGTDRLGQGCIEMIGPVTLVIDRQGVPPRPTFLIESHYENDFGGRTADDVRALEKFLSDNQLLRMTSKADVAKAIARAQLRFTSFPVIDLPRDLHPLVNAPGQIARASARRCRAPRAA